MQEFGWSRNLDPKLFSSLRMPECEARVAGLENVNAVVCAPIHDSCIHILWGQEQGDAVRDLAIEIVRNAFEHGGASGVRLEITPRSIRITDDGACFDPTSLRKASTTSGGAMAVERLFSALQSSLFFRHCRENGENCSEIALVRSRADIEALTSCVVDVDADVLRNREMRIEVMESCSTVYLMFPHVLALSDVLRVPQLLAASLPEGKEYVVVGRAFSDQALKVFAERVPDLRVINFEY